MLERHDPPASKRRATNLSVDDELLREAKELDIKLSRVFEQALREEVRRKRAERWLAENREAVDDYNARVLRHGAFSAGLRRF